MKLFPEYESPVAPLADRLRPESWERFAGQEHLIGEGSSTTRFGGIWLKLVLHIVGAAGDG